MKVLISAPYMLKEKAKVTEYLKGKPFEVTWATVEERLEENDLLKIINEYDGIICGDDRFTPNVYDHAKRLKVVVKWGTGIDSLNQSYAEKKGIKLFRTPNAFTDPVADSTLALILAFARNIHVNDSLMKSGGWSKPQGFSLFEKRIGIIGYGMIGQAVAARLKPFRAKVMAYDIVKKSADEFSTHGVTAASLDEVIETSDFITLHCDLNPTSHHILHSERFLKMKKKPFIINTARGPLIREPDMIKALNLGLIAGVGLDVFEDEPLPTDSPLRKMNNALLSSHNNNSSPTCWDFVHKNSIEMMAKGLGL